MSSIRLLCVVVLIGCGEDGGSGDPVPPDSAAALVDTGPDMVDPCNACVAGETCVQMFGGACSLATTCKATSLSCPPGTCSTECEAALCDEPYQCGYAPPCGTESPSSFRCYGY
jgi:hypothetical protein